MENQTDVFVEESPESRRARLKQMEQDEREARAKQIEAALAPTRNVNAEYFEKQAKLEAEIKANKPKSLPKQTNEDAVAAQAAKYPYKPYDPTAVDPLLEREPQYVQQLHGYTPVKLKPSLTLSSRPDPQALAEYNAKRPQPEMADILANRPMNPVDQRNAELQMRPVPVRPTIPCPNCGTPVEPQTAWHRLSNGEACVLPGETNEALARREGVVICEKSAPAPKKSKR